MNQTSPYTFEDLHAEIEKRYPKNVKEMKLHVLAVASAIESMQLNQKNYAKVKHAVKNLIKEHPELDYSKRVQGIKHY